MKKIICLMLVMSILISAVYSAVPSVSHTNYTTGGAKTNGEETAGESVNVEAVYNYEKNSEKLTPEEAMQRHEKMKKQETTGNEKDVSLFSQSNNEYSEIVYIYSAADLLDIDGHWDGYYEFRNNISISSLNWDPIHLHNATINGNGYTVYMNLNGTTKAGQYVGLFAGSDNYLADLTLKLDYDLSLNSSVVKPLGDVYAHNCSVIGDMNIYIDSVYENLDYAGTVVTLYTDAVYGIDGGSGNRYIGDIKVSGRNTSGGDIRPGSFDVFGLVNCVDSSFKGDIRVEKCPGYMHDHYRWTSQANLYAIQDSRNCHIKGNIHLNADAYLIYGSDECSITGDISADLLSEFAYIYGSGHFTRCKVTCIEASKNSWIRGDIDAKGDDYYYSYSILKMNHVSAINNCENCYVVGDITGRHVTCSGISGNDCYIRGNMRLYDLCNKTTYIAISGYNNTLYGNVHYEVGTGPVTGGRYVVEGSSGYGNIITGRVVVNDVSTGRTITVPRGTTPIYLCDHCNRLTYGDYVKPSYALNEDYYYLGCSECWAYLSEISSFVFEMHPSYMKDYEEPVPSLPTSFSIQVVNAISGYPIAGAEVVADGTEEITDQNGIAVFKQNSHIGGLYIRKNERILHTETDFIAGKGVNVIRVTDVHIDTESFSFGNSASETITGAEIEIAGKEFPIINQSMEFELDLFEAVSVAYNPSDSTLEVLMDLNKLNAPNALAEEWVEKYSAVSDMFDQAIHGDLDADKVARYNKEQQREGNAVRAGKKFALDGEFTVQGFMKLKLDEDVSLLEGGVLLCGSLGTHGTLPVPSTPWYMAYSLEGSLEGGVELSLKSSSYNEPEFNVRGKIGLGIEPSIGVGYGFKDFLAVEVGVEGKLETETELLFVSFPDSFSAKLTASVYALVNALGFEKKGTWNFAEVDIYPRKATPKLMSVASPAELQIVQRDYLDAGGVRLMSAEDGVVKSGLYPYSAVKIAELDGGRKLMVWLDDDTERDLYNKTALFYSLYNGTEWSEPARVHNDGTADFAFDLKGLGSKAVLVWQNINSELTEADDADSTAEKSELCYAEFINSIYGGSTWSEPVQITEGNANYEYEPLIVADGNNISVLWRENKENSVLAEFEDLSESVYQMTVSSGETAAVFTEAHISELLCGDGAVAAVVDADGDYETSGSHLLINGTAVHYSDFLISNLSYANDNFYFYENGCIMKIATDSTEAVMFMENAYANARVIDDTTIICEIADGFASELYISYYKNEEWTLPLQLTDFGGRIRSWKSSVDDGGTISVAAVVADVSTGGEIVTQNVRLMYEQTEPLSDVVLTDVYAENVTCGTTATVSLGVTNNAKDVLKDFEVEVNAGEIALYSGKATISALSTGESGYAEIKVDIPDDFEKQEVRVTVSATGIEETNLENNSKTVVWGYSDLVANLDGKFIKDGGYAVVTATNNGCEEALDTVITLENDKGEKIYSENIGTLAFGESVAVEIEIPEEFRRFDDETNQITYTAKVNGSSEERVLWNNKASYLYENSVDRIVSLDVNEVRLKTGRSYTPNVTITPADGNPVLYMISADDSVATVDENGTVTGVGEGITTISYYTKDAVVSAQLTVVVRDTPGELKISEESNEYGQAYLKIDTTEALLPGETANLFVAVYDTDGKISSANVYNDVKYSKKVELDAVYVGGKTVKMFLWDNTNGMTPIAHSLLYYERFTSGDYMYYKKDGYSYLTKYIGSNSSENLNLPSYIGGGQVVAVERGAFADAEVGNCGLTIPSGIEKIGENAFYNTDILSVTIPETVTEIGSGAFGKCLNLTSFAVSAASESYSTDSKALYNKDKTRLLQFATGAGGYQYNIPDGVERIEVGAFENSKLKEVTIPKDVTFIGKNAFANTDVKINYCGTEADWNLVEKTGAGILAENVSFGAGSVGDYTSRFTCESRYDGLVITNFDGEGFTGETLIIPAEINGEKVLEIDDFAFGGSALAGVKTVVISEGIETIGNYAFEGNDSIEWFVIPSTVRNIFAGGVAPGKNLKGFILAEDNSFFSVEDGVLFNKNKTELICYPACKTGESYQIPEGVTSLAVYAFYICSDLKEVVLPASLGEMDHNDAFLNASSLERFIVADGNTVFSEIDGVLFNIDKNKLILYPAGKGTSYIVPDEVVEIGNNAFRMSKLESVYIGTNVQIIANAAFNCWKMKDIYYEGSESQWNSISIGGWNNALTSATIHYNSEF